MIINGTKANDIETIIVYFKNMSREPLVFINENLISMEQNRFTLIVVENYAEEKREVVHILNIDEVISIKITKNTSKSSQEKHTP